MFYKKFFQQKKKIWIYETIVNANHRNHLIKGKSKFIIDIIDIL